MAKRRILELPFAHFMLAHGESVILRNYNDIYLKRPLNCGLVFYERENKQAFV